MRYNAVIPGIFRARPNRFIAHVEIGGELAVVHVKNTGRCRELLVPGATVYLEQADNPARKTRYDLIAVEKGDLLINMDSQAPNKVFAEWAAAGGFLPGVTAIRPEVSYGSSRFDFRLETAEKTWFVEVKGCTLEENGEARFPDAPTQRGARHIRELQQAVEAGYGAAVVFVIQMKGVTHFTPNDLTHPAFGAALRQAAAAGVQVIARDCLVTPESFVIDKAVSVVL